MEYEGYGGYGGVWQGMRVWQGTVGYGRVRWGRVGYRRGCCSDLLALHCLALRTLTEEGIELLPHAGRLLAQ